VGVHQNDVEQCFFVDVIRCEAITGTTGVDGIYVISLCPQDYAGNDDVKKACETDISDDVIHQLPVSGGHSSLVYRNIYCAACHNESRPRFWLVSLTHCEGSECQLAFHASSYLETVPRTCLRDVNMCTDDWHNASLAIMCRQRAASFVTDGRRVFRNHYCARCNHVDDTQLHCVQVPSVSLLDVVTSFNKSRFDVVYDLNVLERVDDGKQWSDAVARCNNTQVYEPLLSRCIALPYCASSWPHCTQSVRTRRHAFQCPTGLLCINSSDHIRYDNGSIFVLSLQTLIDGDNCRFTNETIYICTSPQTLTSSLTLFSLHDAQRLVSVIATVVGLLALVALLLLYCLLVGCRRDNTSKMSVCFVISMLLYHVMYVVVLAGSRLQFIATKHLQLASLIICAGLQYFAMAAFFWLHVLSIEVFRAVRLWYMTDVPCVTSCTALLVYSLYAWCVPAMIVGWSSALPLLHVAGSQLVHAQSQSCCVLGSIQLLMFIIPTAVSLLIDVVLYVLTALMLCQRSTGQYHTDTLLPDRHSPKVNTQWTTRSWSAERLRAQRRAADAASRRWNDMFVTCMQTSLLLATTWTFCLLPATGSIDWPAALWYVYILLDLALMMTVSLAWSSVERVWYLLVTRKRDRCYDDAAGPTDAAAPAAAAPGGRLAAVAGRHTPPAFNDAASLRAFMRETSI